MGALAGGCGGVGCVWRAGCVCLQRDPAKVKSVAAALQRDLGAGPLERRGSIKIGVGAGGLAEVLRVVVLMTC